MSRWPAIAHPATSNTHRPHGEYPGTIWARVTEKRRIMRKIMYAIVTAFVLATGIGMAAASMPASADTAQCAANSSTHWSGGVKVTANFCDSQEIMTSGVNLDLSVPNKVAAYSRLTFKAANTTNPQEDWLNYEPSATTTNKVFEYAPAATPRTSAWRSRTTAGSPS